MVSTRYVHDFTMVKTRSRDTPSFAIVNGIYVPLRKGTKNHVAPNLKSKKDIARTKMLERYIPHSLNTAKKMPKANKIVTSVPPKVKKTLVDGSSNFAKKRVTRSTMSCKINNKVNCKIHHKRKPQQPAVKGKEKLNLTIKRNNSKVKIEKNDSPEILSASAKSGTAMKSRLTRSSNIDDSSTANKIVLGSMMTTRRMKNNDLENTRSSRDENKSCNMKRRNTPKKTDTEATIPSATSVFMNNSTAGSAHSVANKFATWKQMISYKLNVNNCKYKTKVPSTIYSTTKYASTNNPPEHSKAQNKNNWKQRNEYNTRSTKYNTVRITRTLTKNSNTLKKLTERNFSNKISKVQYKGPSKSRVKQEEKAQIKQSENRAPNTKRVTSYHNSRKNTDVRTEQMKARTKNENEIMVDDGTELNKIPQSNKGDSSKSRPPQINRDVMSKDTENRMKILNTTASTMEGIAFVPYIFNTSPQARPLVNVPVMLDQRDDIPTSKTEAEPVRNKESLPSISYVEIIRRNRTVLPLTYKSKFVLKNGKKIKKKLSLKEQRVYNLLRCYGNKSDAMETIKQHRTEENKNETESISGLSTASVSSKTVSMNKKTEVKEAQHSVILSKDSSKNQNKKTSTLVDNKKKKDIRHQLEEIGLKIKTPLVNFLSKETSFSEKKQACANRKKQEFPEREKQSTKTPTTSEIKEKKSNIKPVQFEKEKYTEHESPKKCLREKGNRQTEHGNKIHGHNDKEINKQRNERSTNTSSLTNNQAYEEMRFFGNKSGNEKRRQHKAKYKIIKENNLTHSKPDNFYINEKNKKNRGGRNEKNNCSSGTETDEEDNESSKNEMSDGQNEKIKLVKKERKQQETKLTTPGIEKRKKLERKNMIDTQPDAPTSITDSDSLRHERRRKRRVVKNRKKIEKAIYLAELGGMCDTSDSSFENESVEYENSPKKHTKDDSKTILDMTDIRNLEVKDKKKQKDETFANKKKGSLEENETSIEAVEKRKIKQTKRDEKNIRKAFYLSEPDSMCETTDSDEGIELENPAKKHAKNDDNIILNDAEITEKKQKTRKVEKKEKESTVKNKTGGEILENIKRNKRQTSRAGKNEEKSISLAELDGRCYTTDRDVENESIGEKSDKKDANNKSSHSGKSKRKNNTLESEPFLETPKTSRKELKKKRSQGDSKDKLMKIKTTQLWKNMEKNKGIDVNYEDSDDSLSEIAENANKKYDRLRYADYWSDNSVETSRITKGSKTSADGKSKVKQCSNVANESFERKKNVFSQNKARETSASKKSDAKHSANNNKNNNEKPKNNERSILFNKPVESVSDKTDKDVSINERRSVINKNNISGESEANHSDLDIFDDSRDNDTMIDQRKEPSPINDTKKKVSDVEKTATSSDKQNNTTVNLKKSEKYENVNKDPIENEEKKKELIEKCIQWTRAQNFKANSSAANMNNQKDIGNYKDYTTRHLDFNLTRPVRILKRKVCDDINKQMKNKRNPPGNDDSFQCYCFNKFFITRVRNKETGNFDVLNVKVRPNKTENLTSLSEVEFCKYCNQLYEKYKSNFILINDEYILNEFVQKHSKDWTKLNQAYGNKIDTRRPSYRYSFSLGTTTSTTLSDESKSKYCDSKSEHSDLALFDQNTLSFDPNLSFDKQQAYQNFKRQHDVTVKINELCDVYNASRTSIDTGSIASEDVFTHPGAFVPHVRPNSTSTKGSQTSQICQKSPTDKPNHFDNIMSEDFATAGNMIDNDVSNEQPMKIDNDSASQCSCSRKRKASVSSNDSDLLDQLLYEYSRKKRSPRSINPHTCCSGKKRIKYSDSFNCYTPKRNKNRLRFNSLYKTYKTKSIGSQRSEVDEYDADWSDSDGESFHNTSCYSCPPLKFERNRDNGVILKQEQRQYIDKVFIKQRGKHLLAHKTYSYSDSEQVIRIQNVKKTFTISKMKGNRDNMKRADEMRDRCRFHNNICNCSEYSNKTYFTNEHCNKKESTDVRQCYDDDSDFNANNIMNKSRPDELKMRKHTNQDNIPNTARVLNPLKDKIQEIQYENLWKKIVDDKQNDENVSSQEQHDSSSIDCVIESDAEDILENKTNEPSNVVHDSGIHSLIVDNDTAEDINSQTISKHDGETPTSSTDSANNISFRINNKVLKPEVSTSKSSSCSADRISFRKLNHTTLSKNKYENIKKEIFEYAKKNGGDNANQYVLKLINKLMKYKEVNMEDFETCLKQLKIIINVSGRKEYLIKRFSYDHVTEEDAAIINNCYDTLYRKYHTEDLEPQIGSFETFKNYLKNADITENINLKADLPAAGEVHLKLNTCEQYNDEITCRVNTTGDETRINISLSSAEHIDAANATNHSMDDDNDNIDSVLNDSIKCEILSQCDDERTANVKVELDTPVFDSTSVKSELNTPGDIKETFDDNIEAEMKIRLKVLSSKSNDEETALLFNVISKSEMDTPNNVHDNTSEENTAIESADITKMSGKPDASLEEMFDKLPEH